MILLREYKLVKEKIISIDKFRGEVVGNDDRNHRFYKNINLCFFNCDYEFNKLKDREEHFYEMRFDDEIKGLYKISFKEKLEQLMIIEKEKEDDEEQTSLVYKFNVNKIISYNEMFTICNGKTMYNEKRKDYEVELKHEFDRNNNDGMLGMIMMNDCIEVELNFIINYTQKDIDNITKPFIDILYKSAGLKNDNNIKRLISSKNKNHDDNVEYVLVRIKKITKKNKNNSLISIYEKQL